jgi:organic hydroperoxide reductase OsmC/OhrA
MEDHAWPAGGMDGVTVEWTGNRGDAARWNPEDMLLASLSACLKLWCLGLCAGACISVVSYRGDARGSPSSQMAT